MNYTLVDGLWIENNFVEEMLLNRGIITEETKKDYYTPSIHNEIPSSCLDNIEEGYQLLIKHLKNNSKIYLVIDCD